MCLVSTYEPNDWRRRILNRKAESAHDYGVLEYGQTRDMTEDEELFWMAYLSDNWVINPS
jgi:hypothetical protein